MHPYRACREMVIELQAQNVATYNPPTVAFISYILTLKLIKHAQNVATIWKLMGKVRFAF